MGPTRARAAWSKLGVNGLSLSNGPPGPDFPVTTAPRLTVRMTARIQSFPDSWRLAGTKTSRYRQIPAEVPRRDQAEHVRHQEHRGKTEVALRSILHRRGLRFRKDHSGQAGKPGIAFPGARVAVFVDGDYRHARVLRQKGPEALYARMKTANRDYWIDKFTKRVKRDDEVTAALEGEGWMVLRFWESDVRGHPDGVANLVEAAVRGH